MSYDATPYLIKLTTDKDIITAADAKAAIYDQYKAISKREISWQSYNFSEERARKQLERVGE